MNIEMIDPILLKPHPKNAKVHTDKQIDRIAKSMDNTGGSLQPIVCDEDMVILAGHGRWMAHKKRGDVECPVFQKTGLSDAQKKKFLLADNQTNAMTGNEFDAVAALITELDQEGVEVSDIGFTEKELDKFLNFEAEEEERDKFEEASEDSRTLRELKDSMLMDQSEYVGEWEMPRLREDRIPDMLPEEFVVWMNRHRTPPLAKGQMHYHLFGRESTKGLDPLQTLVSFYIDDSRFERVWTKLKENTQRFLNADSWGLVMPDFTTTVDMPLPTNIWAMYRSLYVARYWQEAGLMVIPNLVAWDAESSVALAKAIPERPSVVSVQLQTLATSRTRNKSEHGTTGLDPDFVRDWMARDLELIKPETLLVYGSERGLILGREICERHNVKFLGVQNRADAATTSFEDGVL